MNPKSKTSSLITKNKKAFFEYNIEKHFEAGISLLGTEVKSIRLHKGSLSINEAYIKILKSEAILINSYISPYEKGNINNHKDRRDRKLLLHKKEIDRLRSAHSTKKLAIIPISAYWKNGFIKVEIALAKGKDKASKKQYLIEKDIKKNLRESSF